MGAAMSDIQTLVARLQSLDPHTDPEECKACMLEAVEALARGSTNLTIGPLARDGAPETLALGGIWFDRRETTAALTVLLAEARRHASGDDQPA